MVKKINVFHLEIIVEDKEGYWHTVYEKIKGKKRSFSFNSQEFFVPEHKSTEQEITTILDGYKIIRSATFKFAESVRIEFREHNESIRNKHSLVNKYLNIIKNIKIELERIIDDNTILKDGLNGIYGFEKKLNKLTNILQRGLLIKEFSVDLINFAGSYMFALQDDKNKILKLTNELSEISKEVF